MVPNGAKWRWKVPKDEDLSQMVPNVAEWCQIETEWGWMVPNDAEWLQIVLNDHKWYQIMIKANFCNSVHPNLILRI